MQQFMSRLFFFLFFFALMMVGIGIASVLKHPYNVKKDLGYVCYWCKL